MGIDKAYYAMLKSHHLCTRCKTQDAYTLAGRAVCADCAEKMAEKARERRKTNKRYLELAKQRKRERIENGFCPICGKPSDPAGDYKMCAVCRAKYAKQDEKYRDKVKPDRVRRNAEIGVCMKCCAAPVIPGRKVCADCYTKLVDGLKAITLKRNKDVRFLPTDILMQRAVDMGEAIYGRTV